MNKFKYLAYTLVTVMLFSCAGDEELPFVEFDGLSYGAYARKLVGPTGTYDGSFNFFDVANSGAAFTVEYVDEADGANVASYIWTVAYDGGTPVEVLNIASSSFTTGVNGLPSSSFEFTFQQTLDALGLTIDDVEGGNFFDFQATVTKNDGSKFTSVNTGADIVSSAALAGLFQYRANIICPSTLEGTFEATSTSEGVFTDVGVTWEGTVRWENEGNGVYNLFSIAPDGSEFTDAAMGAYYAGYSETAQGGLPLGDLRIVDACNILSWKGVSQWSETYEFLAVDADGATLTLQWLNSFGEGATGTLTRTDGTEWPADLSF